MIKRNDLALIGVFNSKLCHDLIAPAGAAEIGLSLIEEGMTDPETVRLVADSVKRLTAKLSFFRVACSYSKGPGVPSLSEAQKALELFLNAEGKTLSWRINVMESPPQEGEIARKILNLFLQFSGQLAQSGIAKVVLDDKGGVYHIHMTLPVLPGVLKPSHLELFERAVVPMAEATPHNLLELLLVGLFEDKKKPSFVLNKGSEFEELEIRFEVANK